MDAKGEDHPVNEMGKGSMAVHYGLCGPSLPGDVR